MAGQIPEHPQTVAPLAARREMVQPSLWDRLVDDLPGIGAEIARLEAALSAHPEDASAENRKDEKARDRAALAQLRQRHALLQEQGILVTPARLREAVRRDIEDLFGIERLEARYEFSDFERRNPSAGSASGAEDPADLLADFPQVRRSVLNFGVPSFAGRRAGDFDHEALARELREVLATYEPRLRRDTIRVTVAPGTSVGLRIQIEGLLMMTPAPERLRLLTTVDLDTGMAVTALEDG
ncbi:MAG TPA: GPW/gp25 family protein [Paracoccus sp. (in: a-proteobacteria)]|uniref:type VI secretion system baseplate subunit TssE n=1 Tax=Paracoccus sp. TaxID=267 RepID=UPI002C03915F|nr:GPW/gp25 family protein [Paracoccus sp. (in: a-proteobacteria)]HWL56732.1 GPW/gp25 family protein [Paracoccus sp. (in: a-proteobacteria)]